MDSMNGKVIKEGYTFDDLLLVPAYSTVVPADVSLKSFRFFLSQLAQLSKGNMFYKSLIIILVGVPCPLRGITLVVSVTRISVCLKSSIQRGSSKVYSEFSIKNDTPNM